MVKQQNSPVIAHVHENGEVREVKPPKRRHVKPEEAYVMLSTYGAMEVAPLLSPTQHRIVSRILFDYRADEPWARYTAAELMRDLGLTSPLFYRALKQLRDSGLVAKISSTAWIVNPRYGWRGPRPAWEEQMPYATAIDLEVLRRGRR